MRMKEALELQPRAMIGFVGAGGKSSLMQRLAMELAECGARVLVTTSTKMFAEQLKFLAEPVLEENPDQLLGRLKALSPGTSMATAGAGLTADGKITGLSPDFLNDLFRTNLFDYILVEADGSRGKPLKAPAPGEPVLPSLCTTVLPVVGLDALGCSLTEEAVHRHHLVAHLAGQEVGSTVTVETMGAVVHRYTRLAGAFCQGSKVIPLMNKAEHEQHLTEAVRLARKILTPPVKRVLVTSARCSQPVQEVVL